MGSAINAAIWSPFLTNNSFIGKKTVEYMTSNHLGKMNPNVENNRAAMPNVNVGMPTQRPPPQAMQVSPGGYSGQPMVQQPQMESPLLAANEALGGSFGSAF